jgi:AbrB family looped-hinge helix DNA binding protein
MNMQTKLSARGQVVIPKEMRDALNLAVGETLDVRKVGRQIIMESAQAKFPKISYAEFKRQVPPYKGSPVSIDEMTAGIAEIFKDWKI